MQMSLLHAFLLLPVAGGLLEPVFAQHLLPCRLLLFFLLLLHHSVLWG
jgi:hypothetical protein